MYRNLAAALFVHEKVETTHSKAQELRSIVEKNNHKGGQGRRKRRKAFGIA
jgi:ribosomal protein L17